MLKKLLLIICGFSIAACSAPKKDAKTEMENSYKLFVDALLAKDEVAFKNTMSSAAYRKMKNAMLSAKSEFPKTVFENAADFALDFSKLEFLKALENDPNGNLIYYDSIQEHAVILKFVEENENWKFFGASMYGRNEIAEKMKIKDLSFLDEKGFKPDTATPIVETEVTHVDYMAMLDITGDYKISLTLNGFIQESNNGGSRSALLIGGVKKGKNKVQINLSPTENKKNEGSLSVTIRAMIDGAEKEVFTLKEEKPGASISKEFEVE